MRTSEMSITAILPELIYPCLHLGLDIMHYDTSNQTNSILNQEQQHEE